MPFELSDAYLIITPELSDTIVSQRKQAVESLLEAEIIEIHFPAWVELVYWGMPAAGSEGVAALIAAVRAEQVSFPTDPAARELDLRVTAAVVLSEYLRQSDPSGDDWSSAIAALVLAVSRLPPAPPEPRYLALTTQLRVTAQEILDSQALHRRNRNVATIPTVSGADVPALATSMNAALKRMDDKATASRRVDREELQTLWWVFGRHSQAFKQAYADLAVGDAVIAAPCELAQLMLMPPVPAAADFLRAAVDSREAMTLSALVRYTSMGALKLLAPSEDKVSSLLRRHPALMPLTWLAGRLVESERSPWETEFEKKMHVSPTVERPLHDWVEQVFVERVATSFLVEDREPTGEE